MACGPKYVEALISTGEFGGLGFPVREESMLEWVSYLMKKLAPNTKDEVFEKFLRQQVTLASDAALKVAAKLIMEKAAGTPRFCSLYVELCERQLELEKNVSESRFRSCLLNCTKELFLNSFVKEGNPKLKQMLLSVEADSSFRSKQLGIINLIDVLYRHSIMDTEGVHWYLKYLYHPATSPFDEEFLQFAVHLLMSIGQKLKIASDFNGKDYLNQTLVHLKGISTKCSDKTRLMIVELLDLHGLEEVADPEKNDDIQKQLAALSRQLKEVIESRQQAEAEKAKVVEQLRTLKRMLKSSQDDKEKLRVENTALLEECAVGGLSAICDQMQSEKVKLGEHARKHTFLRYLLEKLLQCGDSADSITTDGDNSEFELIHE